MRLSHYWSYTFIACILPHPLQRKCKPTETKLTIAECFKCMLNSTFERLSMGQLPPLSGPVFHDVKTFLSSFDILGADRVGTWRFAEIWKSLQELT
jgi:hypothetical protein